MERKQQLIELMNTVYNLLNEVNAHKGIIASAHLHMYVSCIKSLDKENKSIQEGI